MEWHQRSDGDAVIVSPQGSIDHNTAEDFQDRLMPEVKAAAESGSRIIIDLAGVDYMSSVGLRALMRASKEARAGNVAISVASLNQTMNEIFRISRFDKIFPIHDSVDTALGA